MKKFKIIALLAACLFVAAGCSASEFSLAVDKDGVATINAKNAKDGDFAGAGTFTVGENQEIYVESTLEEGGKITISLTDVSDKEDIDANMEDIDKEAADWKVSIEGPNTVVGIAPKGDYFVYATVEGKATGTVTIYTKEIEDPDTWDKAADKDTALSAVGMESFDIPEGVEIGLGPVQVSEYRTHEGAIKAKIQYPAVDMFVFKGAEDIADPSFVEEEYANEWTQDIDGILVTCYGNREGDATKTVWTRDGYNYAVVVYGLGGDTDFGLSADDLAAIVPSIQ